MAAPRVPFRAAWQRSTSSTRSALGLSRRTSAASRAARAASLAVPQTVDPRHQHALWQEA